MGFLDVIGRLFSGSSKVERVNQPVERARRQGINPMVRNSDDDYHTAASNFAAANRLVRDCEKSE